MNKNELTTLKKLFKDLEVTNKTLEQFSIYSSRLYLVYDNIKFASLKQLINYYIWNEGIEEKKEIDSYIKQFTENKINQTNNDLKIVIDQENGYYDTIKFYITECSENSYIYDFENIHTRVNKELNI